MNGTCSTLHIDCILQQLLILLYMLWLECTALCISCVCRSFAVPAEQLRQTAISEQTLLAAKPGCCVSGTNTSALYSTPTA
jgi:hypothetical protein